MLEALNHWISTNPASAQFYAALASSVLGLLALSVSLLTAWSTNRTVREMREARFQAVRPVLHLSPNISAWKVQWSDKGWFPRFEYKKNDENASAFLLYNTRRGHDRRDADIYAPPVFMLKVHVLTTGQYIRMSVYKSEPKQSAGREWCGSGGFRWLHLDRSRYEHRRAAETADRPRLNEIPFDRPAVPRRGNAIGRHHGEIVTSEL